MKDIDTRTVVIRDRYGNVREPAYPARFADQRILDLDRYERAYAPHHATLREDRR